MAIDRKEKLIIDPVLAYSTYFGGNGNTRIRGVAADADGNAYITGSTQAPDFPLSNPLYYKPGTNYAIGFVSKISADGQTLLYSTYLGDSSAEVDCAGIATDDKGMLM